MNSVKKFYLFLVMLLAVLLFVPNFCSAADISVTDEESLKSAIQNANASSDATTITLSDSITISAPLPDVTKNVTINGNGFKISGNDQWYSTGGSGNQSIITSTAGTLTLKNIRLEHGPKQGAQAYGNGTLVLDGVTISDCKYSGLIANGGIIEIKNLNLNTTVGIEIGKSSTNNIEVTPTIIMNGVLKTTSQSLLYQDTKTPSALTIENKTGSADKLFVTEDSVFITDSNNAVIYKAKNYSNIDIENADMSEDKFATVTIHYTDKTMELVVTKNESLSKYDLSNVKNIDGQVFVHFVNSNNEIFSEDTPITDNIELTAIYKEEETPVENTQTSNTQKDETPKTGSSNYLVHALITVFILTLSIIVLKRKV